MLDTLTEILEGCRTGDAKAVAKLVDRFNRWALDLARALVHDSVLAEDVVQEAFIAALQGIHGLRNTDAFPGWFRQILRRQASRMIRKYGETVSYDNDQIKETMDCAHEWIERDELRKIVRDSVEKLPEAERDAAVRFYIEQQRCVEIAQALSIPPGTVRRRLFDARTRLRNMLVEYVDDRSGECYEKPDKKNLLF